MSSMSMRGLSTFISDVRNCTTKDQEMKRVDKELANIRRNFSDKRIDGYSLKKYTWKLLYIHMLGYEVNIGHMEVLKLVGSNKYSEKVCGYLSMQILWNENTELLKLLVQTVKKDLNPLVDNGLPLNEYIQCLALNFLANMGGREFAEALATDVQKLLTNGNSRSFVRKKAALCLLRMIRLDYYCIHIDQAFSSYLLALLDDPNLGVVTSVISLILGLVAINSSGFDKYTVQKCIVLLAKLSFSKEKKSIYRYYLTVSPWLQVKILRLLTYFPLPTDPNLLSRLHHVLNDILTKTQITKNINKNNADYSILFEALNVIIHYASTQQSQSSPQLAITSDDEHSPTSPPVNTPSGNSQLNDLVNTSLTLLSKFISIKESNFRYLGIETMTRFLVLDSTRVILKKYIGVISSNLYDIDISIQKRAIDLLYTLCDESNSVELIEKFLDLLSKCSIELKSELVIKIAILAEKFTTEQTTQQSNMTDAEASKDYKQYISIILKLIDSAGSYVTEDIWFRTVQIVTNSDESVQAYAVQKSYRLLTSNITIHETGLKVCAYIIGEFGDQITNSDQSTALVPHANGNALVVQNGDASHSTPSGGDDAPLNITGRDLYNVLDKHFLTASNPTKALILTAYMKLTNTYPELRSAVNQVFKQYSSVIDIELQQRSVEYASILNESELDGGASSTALALTSGGAATSSSTRLLESVFDVMPNWDITNRENLLMKKISKTSRMPQPTNPKSSAGEETKSEASDDEDEEEDEDEEDVESSASVNHHTNSSGKHTKQATIDLLGLSLNDPNSTALVVNNSDNTQVSPFAPQSLSDLSSLIGEGSGVIYDNTSILQIGYKIAGTAGDSKHTCKIALYYGNRSDYQISNLMLTMSERQAGHVIRHQIKPSEILNVIPASKQIPHYLLIESLRPFSSYVQVSLSFTWNDTQHIVPLSLPITMSSFITPTPMPYTVFGNVWQKYVNEIVKIAHIPPSTRSTPGEPTSSRIRSYLTNRLHLANIDSPSDNLVIGTGTFHTVTVTMPCLVKIETKDTAARITVHSGHNTVSDALIQTVLLAIEATT